MVHKELALLGIISVIAIAGLILGLQDTYTGSYVAGPGGEKVYGPVYAQFEPSEACLNAGFEPKRPTEVKSVPGGTMAVCKSMQGEVLVPLVQLVKV